MKRLLLSYPLDGSTPVYGGTPKPLITPHTQTSRGDSSNSYIITVHNHTGTHVDAPRHFMPDGKSISDYHIDDLIFNDPLIIECHKAQAEQIVPGDISQQKIGGADCLLLRTGFGRFRGREIYRTKNPSLSADTILWLRRKFPAIRCIGIDTISISSYQNREEGRSAHRAAFMKGEDLNEPLIIIEDLNLNALSSSDKLKKIIVIPWQLSGVDSAPCIVLAEVSRDE